VFRRRLAAAGNALDGVPVVVPVVWEKCDIPRAVSKYQLADAGFPADYLKLGLCRMHRVKSTRIEVQTAIDALADVIVQVATGATRLPPLAGALNFDEFVAAFDNPGTRSIRVAALHDDGFRLGIGGIRTLRHAVEGVAARLDTPWRAVKAGDDVARLLAQFEAAREPVVLVTDEASGAKAPWNLRLAATDAAGRTNFAVLLGVSGLDAGAAELALRRTVPVSLAAGAPHDWFSLDDAAEFARKFTQSVTKLNMELIRAGEPAKVTDARLEDAARKDGIPIDVHPTVAGPGSAGS
jgi:hypothetical protein